MRDFVMMLVRRMDRGTAMPSVEDISSREREKYRTNRNRIESENARSAAPEPVSSQSPRFRTKFMSEFIQAGPKLSSIAATRSPDEKNVESITYSCACRPEIIEIKIDQKVSKSEFSYEFCLS